MLKRDQDVITTAGTETWIFWNPSRCINLISYQRQLEGGCDWSVWLDNHSGCGVYQYFVPLCSVRKWPVQIWDLHNNAYESLGRRLVPICDFLSYQILHIAQVPHSFQWALAWLSQNRLLRLQVHTSCLRCRWLKRAPVRLRAWTLSPYTFLPDNTHDHDQELIPPNLQALRSQAPGCLPGNSHILT